MYGTIKNISDGKITSLIDRVQKNHEIRRSSVEKIYNFVVRLPNNCEFHQFTVRENRELHQFAVWEENRFRQCQLRIENFVDPAWQNAYFVNRTQENCEF